MTDYRLAKLMQLRLQTVSNWRTGRTGIGTEFARKFADACDLEPEYVYACVQAERADSPEEISLLERIASAFGGSRRVALGIVLAAMVAAGTLYAPESNQAVAAVSDAQGIYIMRTMALVLIAALAALYFVPARSSRRPGKPRRAPRPRWLAYLLVFPALTGRTALETREEQTWQTLHAVDVLQTYAIVGDPCFEEGNPVTRAAIGGDPSHADVIAWGVASSALHAGVTQYLLTHDHQTATAASVSGRASPCDASPSAWRPELRHCLPVQCYSRRPRPRPIPALPGLRAPPARRAVGVGDSSCELQLRDA